ncbi:DUF5590 domain-containing protein [Evansella sp. LMS18]|uniref:cell wall elongation regulator TseB-like domain-containing protein n=1 Tax=Evansella sp. LMS18 TaxID=2924033 RepID=UPI0020D1AF00|nr:DUF5590 domain-containing protein [Evansella sp. LMS18]UTR09661.1 DUF5590 domain-containing protein [Evansella sp. LMS18]
MKAWIITVLAVLLAVAAGFMFYLYNSVAEPLTERQQDAVELAFEETDLSEVREVTYYHGRRAYQVIDGADTSGNEVYIWVEELSEEALEAGEEQRVITRLKEEGITREEARDIAVSRLDIDQIQSINLGMIGSTPVYEITYIDQADRHSFYYMTFNDGTYIRHYQFRN